MTTAVVIKVGDRSFIAADTRATGSTNTYKIVKIIRSPNNDAFVAFAGSDTYVKTYESVLSSIIANKNILQEFAKIIFQKHQENEIDISVNTFIGIENGKAYKIAMGYTGFLEVEKDGTLEAIGSGGAISRGAFAILKDQRAYSKLATLDNETIAIMLRTAISKAAELDPATNDEIIVEYTEQRYEEEINQSPNALAIGDNIINVIVATNQITKHREKYTKDALMQLVEAINTTEVPVWFDHGNDARLGKTVLGVWKNALLVERQNGTVEVKAQAYLDNTPQVENLLQQKSRLGASMRCINVEAVSRLGVNYDTITEIKNVREISLTFNPSMTDTRTLKMKLDACGDTRPEIETVFKNDLGLSGAEAEVLFSKMKRTIKNSTLSLNGEEDKEIQGKLETQEEQGKPVENDELVLKLQSEVEELRLSTNAKDGEINKLKETNAGLRSRFDLLASKNKQLIQKMKI